MQRGPLFALLNTVLAELLKKAGRNLNWVSFGVFFGEDDAFALPVERSGAVALFVVGGPRQAHVHQQRSGG